MISVSQNSTVLGLDVHKLTISAAVLPPDADVAVVDKISSDPDAVRRLVGRFEDPRSLVACYEAGPTGYELARQLRSLGVRTEVVAPSLIPVAPGNRVKTDERDARRLALLLRGGQLSGVRVPDVAEEAVRDLCRARADMVIDRTRARHRMAKFLLRHGRIWRDGENWTMKHEAWIAAQRFDEPALDAVLSHYQATLTARVAAVDAIDAELRIYFERAPFAEAVRRLCAYRGVTELGALTLATEVCDWRRFPTAGMFAAFCGLVPSEDSSGERSGAAASPTPATRTCALSSSSRPGPTRAGPRSVPSWVGATRVSIPRSWPGPGPPSSASADASSASTPASRRARPSSPPSPTNSPASCGPR